MERLLVEYRPDAVTDIEAIFLYVLEASGNFGTARDYTDRIYERCESIGNVPKGGTPRPDLGEGIRVVPFERRAVILYRLNGEAIEIINVFYRGRDYAAIFENKQ
ncbi:type II toxin-antitoxin system RelE/ParE family toxin [Rhizobium deserti]|uniref:Type II toxin-antitoxin system RelE/ParE family toxin n=1 Tax=Rhizobium deserti TaxID=2547961 RepID=A0A4R5UJM0_9HYPH|nr:type II toxin-antitoxin system RelE/ParE family toxin [Rhizobium deserti]TDK36939.1 type II toxin-antitoxin system RelE/ParE family toxin [Rhizobium deserti]